MAAAFSAAAAAAAKTTNTKVVTQSPARARSRVRSRSKSPDASLRDFDLDVDVDAHGHTRLLVRKPLRFRSRSRSPPPPSPPSAAYKLSAELNGKQTEPQFTASALRLVQQEAESKPLEVKDGKLAEVIYEAVCIVKRRLLEEAGKGRSFYVDSFNRLFAEATHIDTHVVFRSGWSVVKRCHPIWVVPEDVYHKFGVTREFDALAVKFNETVWTALQKYAVNNGWKLFVTPNHLMFTVQFNHEKSDSFHSDEEFTNWMFTGSKKVNLPLAIAVGIGNIYEVCDEIQSQIGSLGCDENIASAIKDLYDLLDERLPSSSTELPSSPPPPSPPTTLLSSIELRSPVASPLQPRPPPASPISSSSSSSAASSAAESSDA